MNHAVIITPASLKATANALALQYFGGEGDNFTIGLNATGNPDDAPTHYWCAPRMTDEHWAVIQSVLPQLPGTVAKRYDSNANSGYPDTLLGQLGLKRITRPMP